MELQQIEQNVKGRLSEKRFFHSQCVMERCEEIAKKVGFKDIDNIKKIGIAHDVAKEIPNEEKIAYAEKNHIEIDEIERANPTLLHAKLGEDIAIKEFGFTQEMGRAIRAHTTGLEDMDMMCKILFIADRTSKERGFPDIEYINELLEKNIDEAVLYIFDKKITLQIDKKAQMHPQTVIARNWLLAHSNI